MIGGEGPTAPVGLLLEVRSLLVESDAAECGSLYVCIPQKRCHGNTLVATSA
jgi:hypothetical protein